ncbi:efflux RND transporter periplasmic adaptor subunit [Desulfolutivibrio sp.]|uniref:efflux RND transporter periplasmic adaptor subunit n=1 Tax=Desulfolutivibrio sp. TaxID=2773296 RepID=UPI002F96334C
MRSKKFWIIIVLCLAAAFAAWKYFGGQDKAPKVLAEAEVRTGKVRKVLEATGIIKAQVGAIIKIGARATGTIEDMRVKVGDTVRAGQVIALVDSREDRSRQNEATARLARAEAERKQVVEVYPKRIAEAEAELALSQAKHDYAATNLTRQQKLFAQELVSRDVLDQARRDALVAKNELAAREVTLSRTKTEFEKERIKAERSKEEAEAALVTAETKLTYSRVISPIDGVVSVVTVQQGETVVAGLQVANLITVLDPTRLEMWIYVDETDVGQVAPGMRVEFRVDSMPGELFTGAVDQIYPSPEIRDNIVYYQALVRLDPVQSRKLRPEMTTHCQIVVKEKTDVLVIPNAALKWVGNTQVVFVVEDRGRVRETHPELGLAGLNETEVVGGLAAGDKVAVQIVLPGTPRPAAGSGQGGGGSGGSGGAGGRPGGSGPGR